MTEREIQRLIVSLTAGPEHERLYAALIRRAGVAISPAESWALWYVAAYGPIDSPRLTARLNLDAGRAGDLIEALGRRGYVHADAQGATDLTPDGRHAIVALVTAGQEEIALLIRGREPADATKRARILARLTEAALASMPDDGGNRSDLPPELAASGVIAVLRARRPEFLPVLAGYLWDAGVGTIEIPAATEDFELAISALAETPSTVGAGDVVDVAQAQIAVRAGARFVSSPFAAQDVLRFCVDSGVAAIPLASTPGEAEAVWAEGASAIKVLSPGLEQMARALPGVPLIAVGSVDEDSAAGFIRAGACAVMAEGWLLADAADGGSLDEFGRRARRLVTAVAASLTVEQRDG